MSKIREKGNKETEIDLIQIFKNIILLDSEEIDRFLAKRILYFPKLNWLFLLMDVSGIVVRNTPIFLKIIESFGRKN